ncbi:group III truncated hemoglobin [Salinarimonas sp. NSM]|uniref:group III truncated hemoglobin n=1 Tax=Salinarimonas sp. NSM TaxID=3458003 RepID=UPI004037209F
MTDTRIRLVEPAAEISEADVARLVHAFYGRVREDSVLGPVFEDRLAGRWDAHLDKMVDFWSSVARGTGRYQGKPHVAHRGMDLDEAIFARWLALFEATARDVCSPDGAAFFADRAQRIAESLMIGLGVGPKALRLPV